MGVTVLDDYAAPNPGKAVAHPLPEGIDGVQALLDAPGTTDAQRVLLALCGLCGCRVSEALQLTAGDVDLAGSVITVRGKGDKTRKIPLSTQAFAIVAHAALGAASPDVSLVGLSDRTARRAITRLCERVLHHSGASHDLRMTFGTAVYSNGGIRAAQELLGHADLKTTQGYTMVPWQALQSAVEL